MANAVTELLSSIVKSEPEHENGFTITRFTLNGEPHAAAIVGAVTDAYPDVDVEAALDAIGAGGKVTLIQSGSSAFGAGIISAHEGTLFTPTRSTCTWAYLPKGKRTKGFGIQPDRLLDVIPGYNAAEATRRVAEVRALFPQLRPLTIERLRELPERGDTCTLAVMGRWALGSVQYDAVWLLHSFLRGGHLEGVDDIIEGVLFVRPEVGESEHGSVYGKDLLRIGGEIIDAPAVTLAEALSWTDLEHEEILRRVTA